LEASSAKIFLTIIKTPIPILWFSLYIHFIFHKISPLYLLYLPRVMLISLVRLAGGEPGDYCVGDSCLNFVLVINICSVLQKKKLVAGY